MSLNIDHDRCNATTIRRLVTRHSNTRRSRSAQNAPRRAITTVGAIKRFQSAFHAVGHTNRIARTARSSTHHVMNKPLRMIQLNVRKQGAVLESLMNDEETKDTMALAIQEPQARRIQGRLLTTPMGHHKWTKMVPSAWREGR